MSATSETRRKLVEEHAFLFCTLLWNFACHYCNLTYRDWSHRRLDDVDEIPPLYDMICSNEALYYHVGLAQSCSCSRLSAEIR